MADIFEKFKTIEYANNIATNILSRVVFSEAAKKTASLYYPYAIENGERADIIAANYYGDSKYSWVVYYSNLIVDPYFEWPLNENEFNTHIVKKYGSVSNAATTIICYKVNWEGDQSILDTSGYSSLPSNLKKYWNPIEGYSGVVGYERAKLDFSIETNKTISLKVANTSGLFTNDKITQYTTTGIQFGQAYIKTISNTNIILQHVTGEFKTSGSNVSVNDVMLIAGAIKNEGNTYSSNTDSYTLLNTSIPDAEVIYWTQLNALDYESAINDSKKIIRLLDKNYLDQVENELSDLL